MIRDDNNLMVGDKVKAISEQPIGLAGNVVFVSDNNPERYLVRFIGWDEGHDGNEGREFREKLGILESNKECWWIDRKDLKLLNN